MRRAMEGTHWWVSWTAGGLWKMLEVLGWDWRTLGITWPLTPACLPLCFVLWPVNAACSLSDAGRPTVSTWYTAGHRVSKECWTQVLTYIHTGLMCMLLVYDWMYLYFNPTATMIILLNFWWLFYIICNFFLHQNHFHCPIYTWLNYSISQKLLIDMQRSARWGFNAPTI